MSDFINSKVEQVYDDFQYGKSGFDAILSTAVGDLKEAVNKAKDNAKKQHKRYFQFDETKTLSDELTTWLKDFGDKISQGFNEASPKTIGETAPEFAGVCIAAMEMNPRNTKEIKKVLDRILNDYEKNPHQDIKFYESFHKMYTAAFRSTGNMENAKAANLVADKMEIIKGAGTPEKYLSRMIEKPTQENLEAFKMSWKKELENNPEKTAENILSYAKMIHKIPDQAIKTIAYAVVTISLKEALENEVKNSPDKKEDIEQSMINILDIEELVGLKEQADKYRTPFENEMLEIRKKRDNRLRIDKQIHKLLNIPNKKLGVERVSDKPFLPTKAEMKKVANILVQYSKIDHSIITSIMGKIDKENFSNVDDFILDKIKDVTFKMQYGEEIEEKITQLRSQMHNKVVKEKSPAPHGVVTEKRNKKAGNKNKKAPKTTVVLDIKDIKKSDGITK